MEHVEQATAAPGEKRQLRESLYEVTGSIASIDAPMHDVSVFGDAPGSRHVRGELRVQVLTAAGTFPVPWRGREPKIGDRVTITVADAE